MIEFSHPGLPEHLQPWAESIEIDEATRRVYRRASAQIVQRVVQEHSTEGDTLLEIGCGTGELRVQIDSAHDGPYIQTDQNQNYLDINTFYNPKSTLVRAKNDQLPVADDSLDIVAGLNVLDIAMGTPPDYSEIARVLKPGGRLLHFHDRRPYIPFLINNIPEDEIPFPWVDEGLQGFQLVGTELFDEELTPRLALYPKAIRRNPKLIEEGRAFMPALIDFQSQNVEEFYGEQAYKIGFGNLFMQQTRLLLEAAGLKVEYAKFDTASVHLKPEEVRHATEAIKMPYGGENTLVKNRNGVYRFIDTDTEHGDGDGVQLDFSLSVLVARKPQ
jgi:ubiquinone/menaquinone biosynthesis C-methylase UbiE